MFSWAAVAAARALTASASARAPDANVSRFTTRSSVGCSASTGGAAVRESRMVAVEEAAARAAPAKDLLAITCSLATAAISSASLIAFSIEASIPAVASLAASFSIPLMPNSGALPAKGLVTLGVSRATGRWSEDARPSDQAWASAAAAADSTAAAAACSAPASRDLATSSDHCAKASPEAAARAWAAAAACSALDASLSAADASSTTVASATARAAEGPAIWVMALVDLARAASAKRLAISESAARSCACPRFGRAMARARSRAARSEMSVPIHASCASFFFFTATSRACSALRHASSSFMSAARPSLCASRRFALRSSASASASARATAHPASCSSLIRISS
mmetsp:Transcript_28785/g.91906  ORF Transcript_28785/g.91906 Transcript_28785/m.91906 type:complete len:344 (+) Transcript_28785:1068-2099(+)